MSTTKKIILILIGVIVVGLTALYFLNKPANTDGTSGAGGFSVKNFFPFGNGDTTVINTDNTDTSNGADTTSDQTNGGVGQNNTAPIAKLRKISERPVSGAIIFTKGTTSIIRFSEKATGNVYEARSDSTEVKRLTNETIPKIARAYWLKDGSGFLAQSIDSNENILTSFIKLQVNTGSSTQPIPYNTLISNLPVGIKEISVSPDSKKIFYYISNTEASGYVSNPDGTSPSLVFSNYLTEWLPQWYGGSNISLATKASSISPSFGFVLNSTNKTMSKTYNNVYGVSSLMAPDGKHILLGSGSSPLSLFEVSSSKSTSVNINTLPEKCIWDPTDTKFVFCGVPISSPAGNYPDTWYQGAASTEDLIQKINVYDLYTYILSDPRQEAQANIDVSNIQSSADGAFLIFTNKKDSSLWLLSTN